MSKRSNALEAMPPAVQAQLRELGENLSVARKRRRESRKAWAERIGVSEPTLTRMEKGDPSVSMGVYATALWLMGRAPAIAALAAPEHDMGALEDAVRVAKSRASRKPVSIYQAGKIAGLLPSHFDLSPAMGAALWPGDGLTATEKAGVWDSMAPVGAGLAAVAGAVAVAGAGAGAGAGRSGPAGKKPGGRKP